jgi:hypothetical protein
MASADVCCRGPVDFHRRLIPGVPAEVGHGRPDTGAQTVPFKAHQRRVRLTRGPNFGERREYSACTFPRLLERLALCGLNTFDVSPFVY